MTGEAFVSGQTSTAAAADDHHHHKDIIEYAIKITSKPVLKLIDSQDACHSFYNQPYIFKFIC